MAGETTIEKIDLDKVDWRGSREFFESLGETLDRLDDKDEAYDFTWVGKRKAVIEAGAPINKTFRPNVEASKDWETTENLFIEGDNLDALKLLQESYLGKVKMIYIDPPYNTGKDFVYRDNFKANVEDYDEETEYKDDVGNIQYKKNEKSNGRYHSDWLSMMYPRLKLARNLLTEDGVIFISIDDNEQANLKKLCDEIFGEENLVENYIWESNFRPDNSSQLERENAQHVLCFARDKGSLGSLVGAQKATEGLPSLTKSSMKESTLRFMPDWVEIVLPDGVYENGIKKSGYKLEDQVEIKDGRPTLPFSLTGRVIWSQGYLEDQVSNGTKIVIKGEGFVPYSKKVETGQLAPTTLIPKDAVGDVLAGNAEIKSLFGSPVFNHPKPVSLLRYLINSATNSMPEAIVLDFFAGSASTAHAVMQLNAEDDFGRKWVMVQLPEDTFQIRNGKKVPLKESNAAFEAGYETIPEISRERIRRAGEKIAKEHPDAKVDYGFRALTIADTNYKDVYKSASEINQQLVMETVDNVKDDRTDLDLLFGVLTASALELNRPIETREISGSTVYLYDYFGEVSGLVACFAESVSEETIKEIAALKPITAVFKDSSFSDSQAKVNLSEHFRIISPDTKVKVI